MLSNRRYSVEVRERTVWLYFDHREGFLSDWVAIGSIAEKFGMHVGDASEVGLAGRGRSGSAVGGDGWMSVSGCASWSVRIASCVGLMRSCGMRRFSL